MTQTSSQVHNIGVVNQMTGEQKDRLILQIVNAFDGSEWDSDLTADTADMLTNLGFEISDPDDRPCGTCGGSHLVLSSTSGEPDDCPECG